MTGNEQAQLVLLDNWNAWSEGHFISPSAGGGFGYQEAVRNVFTDRRNLPDYRAPDQLSFGPYGPERPK
jgi:hypothetical protein